MSGYTGRAPTAPVAGVEETHFLRKPFSVAALATTVRAVLDEV
jgi:hypothetical protein